MAINIKKEEIITEMFISAAARAFIIKLFKCLPIQEGFKFSFKSSHTLRFPKISR